MYGAITGLRFAGLFDGNIMPKKPVREEGCDLCPPMPGMTTGLEGRLLEGYPIRGEGVALREMTPIRFAGQDAYNYGFSGKFDDADRPYWLV